MRGEEVGTMGNTTPGECLKALRLQRGLSRPEFAAKAGLSVSYLEKVERGARALTPGVAATAASALGVSTDILMGGSADADEGLEQPLEDAIRDFDVPTVEPPEDPEMGAMMARAYALRDAVEVRRLLEAMPGVLRSATAMALHTNTAAAWSTLTDAYSLVYWLAARYRWRLVADLAVARQEWASRDADPLSRAITARDRAGAYLNFGQPETGLTVIDRAISQAETDLQGDELAYAIGVLNLRGLTLAGRVPGLSEEVDRHTASAWQQAEILGKDRQPRGHTFGPNNTATHTVATAVDMGRPHEAVRLGADAPTFLTDLPPTRRAPTYINLARAELDMGNRDTSLDHLVTAFAIAPEFARIHPMGREVLRVVYSLHRQSNPRLNKLARMASL